MKKENLEKIIHLRHELHEYPELSLQETHTKARLMSFIRDNTSLTITDMGSWFYVSKLPSSSLAASSGTSSGEFPVLPNAIGFRADMDALPIEEALDLPYRSRIPGVSHKCGHDGHSSALAGLALELNEMEVTRPVYLIFQHAEEIGRGGQVCSELIPEKHISEIYAFHNLSGYPEGSVAVRRGLTQPASKGLTIHLTGKACHASNPEEGRNPASSIAELISFINESLKKPSKGMLLCTIVHVQAGSRDFGVSAGEGELSCTLRAENEDEMNSFENRLRSRAAGLASRDGLRISFSVSDPFPETRNDDACLNKVISCAQNQGREVIEMKNLWRASEDFGWYLKKCPGAIFYLGNGIDYAPLHTAEYDFNDNNLERAVDMFLALLQ